MSSSANRSTAKQLSSTTLVAVSRHHRFKSILLTAVRLATQNSAGRGSACMRVNCVKVSIIRMAAANTGRWRLDSFGNFQINLNFRSRDLTDMSTSAIYASCTLSQFALCKFSTVSYYVFVAIFESRELINYSVHVGYFHLQFVVKLI